MCCRDWTRWMGLVVLATAAASARANEGSEEPPTDASPSAQEAAPTEPVPPASDPAFADVDVSEEVIVYGDLFARWDDTRWSVATEVGLPFPLTFAADLNEEFSSPMFQVRAILACDKDWKLGRRKYEVSCKMEDFAMLAAPVNRRTSRTENRLEIGSQIVQEVDAKLTGAALQLQVADDGRVTNVDIEGVPTSNRRTNAAHETLRQVMSRVILGFDLKLRKGNQLNEGKWVEYNSALMGMPVPGGMTTQGSSMVVHYLNRFEGHTLVQSIGKGLISVGADSWSGELIGVSIFDLDGGYMTERVWALEATNTAGSFFGKSGYWHAGRITMLGENDHPELGATGLTNGPNEGDPRLPAWVPIER